MGDTSIEWTQMTWNPIRGCSLVSTGCRLCYAMKQAHRFSGPGGAYEGLTKQTPAGPQWTGKVRLVPEALAEPFHWRKPRRVFVNSMSDLFHDDVPDEFLDQVFAVMALSPQHTFQVLTKRPERMLRWFTGGIRRNIPVYNEAADILKGDWSRAPGDMASTRSSGGTWWPLRNVWLGVSVEDQRSAHTRIPVLLRTPAVVRFLSCEPLLGPIDLRNIDYEHVTRIDSLTGDHGWPVPHAEGDCRLDWVIVGGESGPHARPCDVGWVRRIVEQCRDARVPCFVKQLGALPFQGDGRHAHVCGDRHYGVTCDQGDPCPHCGRHPTTHWPKLPLQDPKGGDPAEWPADLRVRELPAATPQRGNPGASKAKANPLGRERAAE